MSKREITTLAGGCFWCLEAVYDGMEGVLSVESGYMGGRQPNPTYRDVCTGRTGHAEVVQVTFDPDVASYRDILEVFFAIHDPTTLNRQGNDAGTQYRSAIFYHSDEQRATAQEVIRELTAAKAFHDYHQQYFANNPQQPYCSYVVAPKVQKFRHKFAKKVKQTV